MDDLIIENQTLMRYEGRGGKVTVPCGVKAIGFAAFANSDITEVVIPRGVETVDFGAFMGCESLKRVHIGYGLASVGAYAFSESGLEIVILEKMSPWNSLPFCMTVPIFRLTERRSRVFRSLPS